VVLNNIFELEQTYKQWALYIYIILRVQLFIGIFTFRVLVTFVDMPGGLILVSKYNFFEILSHYSANDIYVHI